MNDYIEMAKQRMFEHLLASNVIPYSAEWQFEPLAKLMPDRIIDPLGQEVPIGRPQAVDANWNYPSDGNPGARPTRARRTVPIEQILVGWGRAFNPNTNTVNIRLMLAAVTTTPRTTGVVSIPVGPDGPFPPRNNATGEFDVDPAVVLFLKQGLNSTILQAVASIPVQQDVQGVNIVERTTNG